MARVWRRSIQIDRAQPIFIAVFARPFVQGKRCFRKLRPDGQVVGRDCHPAFSGFNRPLHYQLLSVP